MQDSNLQATCATVFRTAALPIRLIFWERKNVRSEVETSCSLLCWKLAGAFRFELKISVLETDVLPIETKRL